VAELAPLVPSGARFEFGQSPFHVKGVLYRNTQGYLRAEVDGGMDTLLAAIEEPALREFISQPFLPSSKYDVMPVPALIDREAKATGQSLEAYLESRTAWQARHDIHGIYRMLLKLTSPERVMSRLPRLLVQLFDFPEVTFDATGERARLLEFSRIPQPLEAWLRVGFRVYAQTALELAGARQVVSDFERSEDGPLEMGLRLRTMRMHVSWS